MALSDKVKESLEDAQADLRTALHYAARSEKPTVVRAIADALYMIDSTVKYEQFSDQIERKFGSNGNFF